MLPFSTEIFDLAVSHVLNTVDKSMGILVTAVSHLGTSRENRAQTRGRRERREGGKEGGQGGGKEWEEERKRVREEGRKGREEIITV